MRNRWKFIFYPAAATIAILTFCLWLVHGCTYTDVRQEHLNACETYTSALTNVLVWKDAGKLSESQLTALRQVEAQATPLCMTAETTAEGAALVYEAIGALERLVLTLETP